MDSQTAVALTTAVLSFGASIYTVVTNRRKTGAEADSTTATAYETLSKTVKSLGDEVNELRETAAQREAYVVYLIDGIRKHSDWKPMTFYRWRQVPNGKPKA